MRIIRAVGILSVASMLALAGPVLAQNATNDTTGSTSSQDPLSDETGMAALGVDISGVGATPEAAKEFVAGLQADAQDSINQACTNIITNPATVTANVLQFCENLTGQMPAQ